MSPVIEVAPLGFPWQTLDPFLFCVHHNDAYPRGDAQMAPVANLAGRQLGQDFSGKDGFSMYHGRLVPGFPQHPHRGFETVTIARRGLIDHSDSLGATARFGRGDVQWLTAGGGIVHSEMFPLVHENADNPTELFQIWLNLPAKSKMVKPHFSMLWEPQIPDVTQTDAAGRVTKIRVIAGTFFEETAPPPPPSSWASEPGTDVGILTLKMAPDARVTLPAAKAGTNRVLYFFAGKSVDISGTKVEKGHVILVHPDHELVLTNGETEGELLLLQGRPIDEPVVQYGPFVMNTREEIQTAFSDYQKTQFGGWPFERDDPVHPREKTRFAKHADGRIEDGPARDND